MIEKINNAWNELPDVAQAILFVSAVVLFWHIILH